MLDGCFQLHQPQKAVEFLEFMYKKGYTCTLPMYRTCLQGLLDHGLYKDVDVIFDQVHSFQLITPIYNIVLQSCVHQGNQFQFQSVWKKLLADPNCKPNIISFQLNLKMHLLIRDLDSCKHTLETMITLGIDPLIDDLIQFLQASLESRLYQHAIYCISILSKQKHQIHTDLLVPHSMQLQNHMLKMQKEYGIIELYKLLFQNMIPMESVLVLVMDTYRKNKDLVGVVTTWQRIEKEYPKPDPKSVQVLLHSCFELGQEKTSMAIHMTMESKGYKTTKKGYEYYLMLMISHTDCSAVPALIVELKNQGIQLHLLWSWIQQYFATKLDTKNERKYKYIVDFCNEMFPEMMMERE
jgi:hypothetical protein